MKCKDCRFTLPCYAGKFGEFGPHGINTSLCPSCGRLSLEFYQQNVVWTFFCPERVKTDEDYEYWKTWRKKRGFSTGEAGVTIPGSRMPSNYRNEIPPSAYYASEPQKEYWNVHTGLALHLCYRCWNSAPISGSHVVDLDKKPSRNAKRSQRDGVRLHLPKRPKRRKKKRARAKYEKRRKTRERHKVAYS